MEAHAEVHRYPAGARQRPSTGLAFDLRRARLAPSTQAAMDRVTYLAAEALDVPAVCASLVDSERRLFMSSYGPPVSTALLLSHAFRKHVVASRRPLVVTDAWSDPLVAHNPAVRDGTVRACVGIPFRTPYGRAVGALLAMDRKPRPWTPSQIDLIEKLSALIVSEMEVGAAVRRASHGDARSVSLPAR